MKILINSLRNALTFFFLGGCIGCFSFFTSCAESSEPTSNQHAPSVDEIKHIYNHYIQGQYSDFVSHIASCDGKPRFYKEQIINVYRTQAQLRKEQYGEIDSISVQRIEVSPHTHHAKAYILHHYTKAPREEVLLQMVYHKNKWMIK